MTCTLKNWHGNAPTGIGFPPDNFFDQLSNSGHGKKRIKGALPGPELVIVPVFISPKRNSGSNSSTSERVAALAEGFHQRFHSFGSIPLLDNYPPTIEIPLRPPSINKSSLRNSRLRIDLDAPEALDSNNEPLTPRSKNVNNITDKSESSRDCNGISNSQMSNNSESFNIPITDIIVVDTDGSHSQQNGDRGTCPQDIDMHEIQQMYITSMNSGYFEFTFYSKNAQDVMLAFLQSTLPSERITHTRLRPSSEMAIAPNAVHPDASYDMDYLTAKEMNDILKSESFSERMLSKVQHVFSTFDTITNQFTECVSCNTKIRPTSPMAISKREVGFSEATIDGSVGPHSRSDVPFMFSYEDNDTHLRDSAPSTDINSYISYSVLSHGGGSEHSSSFSRDTDRLKKKKLLPPPFLLS